MLQHKVNEVIIAILYAHSLNPNQDIEDLINLVMLEYKAEARFKNDVIDTLDKITLSIDTLDDIIRQHSKAYDIDRITKADLSILRFMVYFIFNEQYTFDTSTILEEAARLSKKFCSTFSMQFILATLQDIISNTMAPPNSSL